MFGAPSAPTQELHAAADVGYRSQVPKATSKWTSQSELGFMLRS